MDNIKHVIESRSAKKFLPVRKEEGEGGCGVIGFASSQQIEGKHLLPALTQMCNRGNGKGGGIAAVGLAPAFFGILPQILDTHYLIAIAYLDKSCQTELEKNYIHSIFELAHQFEFPHLSDFRTLPQLEVEPPHVVCYFVKVKPQKIAEFKKLHQLSLATQKIEDELVFQNTQHLNAQFYLAHAEKRAFVLSHGKNLLVLKMVGFADDVIRYYQLENFKAHVWIGHHRYPTKGRVWHPGGAHPFIGVNEALVHNGDFANYTSMCEYLAMRHLYPQFSTDTEVAALLFDLLSRTYEYPLEYVIEALAPTTERDFALLPDHKRNIYDSLQKTHIHGSPDGPWFFLIAQSNPEKNPIYRLIGITDTSMLRPQVFAIQRGKFAIGLAASEKQAIDAVLLSLEKDGLTWRRADEYWNARGGSYTDGGAFLFDAQSDALICRDKFGQVLFEEERKPFYIHQEVSKEALLPDLAPDELCFWFKKQMLQMDYPELQNLLEACAFHPNRKRSLTLFTFLMDLPTPMQKMRRSCVLALIDQSMDHFLEALKHNPSEQYFYIGFNQPDKQVPCEKTMVIDARGFPAQGSDSLARKLVQLYGQGAKKFMILHCQGQRFIGNGFGPDSKGVEIDVYGSSGDYLASGIDGARIAVHGSGQDQLAQIMKEGTLIVYGDVGQTFLYGGKGGEAYILGSAAGRPLINAVGNPRVVINGTCLDYLAESFMAGSPLKGGGFAIINGIKFNEEAELIDLETPYPGNNLFSLASGGALYIRDPAQKITNDQLNGGEIAQVFHSDWELILPYLEKNAALFQIPVERLLSYQGERISYHQAFRKIHPASVRVLQEEEAWVKGQT